MKYQCNRPLVVTVFIDGYENQDESFRKSTNPLMVQDPTIIFKKSFLCLYSEDVKTKSILLKFPNRLLYKSSLLMKKASSMEDMKLKVCFAQNVKSKFLEDDKYLC